MSRDDAFFGSILGTVIQDDTTPVDIITFAEASWGLKTKLNPMQKFILRVFYGLPLTTDLVPVYDDVLDKKFGDFSEIDFYEWLSAQKFNSGAYISVKNYKPGKEFRDLTLCCGRRGGKSVIAGVISSYEVYRTLKRSKDPIRYYNLLEGNPISFLTVAPTEAQADTCYKMTRGLCQNSSTLQDSVKNPTDSDFCVMSESDKEKARFAKIVPSIEVKRGNSSSNATRSGAIKVVVMDEANFFESLAQADAMYQATHPSTVTFKDGKYVMISSPLLREGFFYNHCLEASSGEIDGHLLIQAYSALMNPERLESDALKADKKKNIVKFNAEYGARFVEFADGWIDNKDDFRRCINRSRKERNERGFPGILYYFGGDVGLKNDGTAYCICHWDDTLGKVIIDYIDCWFSGSSDVWKVDEKATIYSKYNKMKHMQSLKLEDIAEEISSIDKYFPIAAGEIDQANSAGLMENLSKKNLDVVFEVKHMTDRLNHDYFEFFRDFYSSGLIEFYEDDSVMQEFFNLVLLKHPKLTKVEAPNLDGFHDDIFSAVVKAVYLCAKNHSSAISGGKNQKAQLKRGGYASSGYVSPVMSRRGVHISRSRTSRR